LLAEVELFASVPNAAYLPGDTPEGICDRLDAFSADPR
jgi:hypothetical protein